jgi:uncharacterized protein YPO0396
MSDLLAALGDEFALDDTHGQYRMTGIAMLNWGTFDGHRRIQVSPRGHLLTGKSGHGKSTILDAISVVMHAPGALDLNAAARDSVARGRDRTIMSYIRGAYASLLDDDGIPVVQYHRNGSTWSALSIEFTHPQHGVITLIRVFKVSDTATSTDQITKVGMIVEGSFHLPDLKEYVVAQRLETKALKKRFEPIHVSSDFASYQERFMRLFGMTPQSLRLLSNTQSMKGLSSLDGLIRDYMLDEPQTAKHADLATANHETTKAAFAAVEDARKQRDALRPLRDLSGTVATAGGAQAHLKEQAVAIVRVRTERSITGLEAALATAQGNASKESEKIENADRRLRDLQGQLAVETARYNGNGGAEQFIVKQEIEQHKSQLAERERAGAVFSRHVAAADLAVPDSQQEFDQLRDSATDTLSALDDDAPTRKAARDTLVIAAGKAKADKEAAEREAMALDGNSSNVGVGGREVRSRIADATGVPAVRLPYGAELLQVRSGEERWQGAIERVLRPFALTLLVPSEHYDTVKDYVDANNMRSDVTFQPVWQFSPVGETAVDRIPGKLDVAPGEFHDWLRAELVKRFDYRCVMNLGETSHREQAVTINGLVRHKGDRHAKYDRHPIGDRTRWLLGFDNTAKKNAYRDRVTELVKAFHAADAAVTTHDAGDKKVNDRRSALERILEQEWDLVDTASVVEMLSQLERSRRRMLTPELSDILDAMERIEDGKQRIQGTRDEAVGRKGGHDRDIERFAGEVAEQRIALSALIVPDDGIRQVVSDRFELASASSGVRGLDEEERAVRAEIQGEIDAYSAEVRKAENGMTRIISQFVADWPELCSEHGDSLDSLPDFLGKLDTIEQDRLPDFEEQFRTMVLTGPHNHLSDLSNTLDEERRVIGRRLDPINTALRALPYNVGTILQIVPSDVAPAELHEFTRELHTYFSLNQINNRNRGDITSIEQQFQVLSSIIDKLAGGTGTGTGTGWRNKVLDVRQHVSFAGYEYRDDVHVDTHRSGDGRSGGQRAKLLTFVLAAALRYQLTRDGEMPSFAAVPMDEALSRADVEFTEQSLNVFRDFGFQMILATPNKMVPTFIPYVGTISLVSMDEKDHLSTVRHIISEPAAAEVIVG